MRMNTAAVRKWYCQRCRKEKPWYQLNRWIVLLPTLLDKLYIFARAFTRLFSSHFLSSMTPADYHRHRIIYSSFRSCLLSLNSHIFRYWNNKIQNNRKIRSKTKILEIVHYRIKLSALPLASYIFIKVIIIIILTYLYVCKTKRSTATNVSRRVLTLRMLRRLPRIGRKCFGHPDVWRSAYVASST